MKNLDHEDWQTDAHLKDVADSLPDLGRSAEDKDSARPEYDLCAPKAGQQVVQAVPGASWDPQCIKNGEIDDHQGSCFSHGELGVPEKETEGEHMKLDLFKECYR